MRWICVLAEWQFLGERGWQGEPLTKSPDDSRGDLVVDLQSTFLSFFSPLEGFNA